MENKVWGDPMPNKSQKEKSWSFSDQPLGKSKFYFNVAKEGPGQSRKCGESDGDASKQFITVCQALGRGANGQGVPSCSSRLFLNRVSLCHFFLNEVCLLWCSHSLPLNMSLLKMNKNRKHSRLKKERRTGKFGLVFSYSQWSLCQLKKHL